MTDLSNLPDLVQPATEFALKVLEPGYEKLKAKLGAEAATAMVGAWDWLKGRLIGKRPAAAEVVSDLEATPQEADVQAAFRQQLRKALSDDPAFAAELAERLRALPVPVPAVAITQSSTQTGDGNVSTQITGSSNQVTLR